MYFTYRLFSLTSALEATCAEALRHGARGAWGTLASVAALPRGLWLHSLQAEIVFPSPSLRWPVERGLCKSDVQSRDV